MKKLLLIALVIFGDCFAMGGNAHQEAKEKFLQTLQSMIEMDARLDDLIKDPNFPLEGLINMLSQNKKEFLDEFLIYALPIAGVEAFEKLITMRNKTKKNLVALTLMNCQEQRKKHLALCNAGLALGVSSAAYISVLTYFYEEFRTSKFLVPCCLADAGAFCYSYYKKTKIKATPKQTLSDAIMQVFPDARDPQTIKGLMPTLAADNPFALPINELEKGSVLFDVFGYKSEVQEVVDAQCKAFEGRIESIKKLYKIARKTRDVDAFLHLAKLLESTEVSLKKIKD